MPDPRAGSELRRLLVRRRAALAAEYRRLRRDKIATGGDERWPGWSRWMSIPVWQDAIDRLLEDERL